MALTPGAPAAAPVPLAPVALAEEASVPPVANALAAAAPWPPVPAGSAVSLLELMDAPPLSEATSSTWAALTRSFPTFVAVTLLPSSEPLTVTTTGTVAGCVSWDSLASNDANRFTTVCSPGVSCAIFSDWKGTVI